MTWLLNAWNAAKTRVIAVLAAIVAAGAAYLLGRRQGSSSATAQIDAQHQAQQAENNAAAAQAAADHAEVRHEVESDTATLPDAPAQPVASSDPATAAGKLRDEGWTRD